MYRGAHAFAAFALAFALLASGCNCSNNKCSPSNCPGCCDSAGTCQGGFLATHCGTAGAACVECTLGQSCAAGHCGIVSAGGGSGGGGVGTGGGSGTGGGGGGFGVGGGSGGQFCQSFATAYCDYAVRCGTVDSSARTECSSFVTSFYCASFASITKGYQTLNQANATACVNFVENATCDQNPLSGGSSPCSGLATPASSTGEGCLSSADCTTPGDGCGGTNACAMVCEASGPLGAPCPCNDGLRCDQVSGTCTNPHNVGEMCQPYVSSECVASAICDSNSYTCVSLPGAGSHCYQSSYCAPNAYCDYDNANYTCKPRIGQDQPCTTYDSCVLGLYCSYGSSGATCKPLQGQGATCSPGDSSCQAGLTCKNNQCQPPGGVNAACQYYGDCASSLDCDSVLHTCQQYSYSVPQGGACTESALWCAYPNVCHGALENPDGGVGSQGTCGPSMLGDSCSSLYSQGCPAQAYCQLADAGVGTCVSSSNGSPCGATADCPTGDYCSAGSICVPKGASGAPCSGSGSCQSPFQCVSQSNDGGLDGLCGTLGELNDSCAGTNSCKFPYTCINGFCASSAHANEPCLNGYLCFNGACQADAGITGYGLCTGTHHADGEPCFYPSDCQSGNCKSFSVCAPSCP